MLRKSVALPGKYKVGDLVMYKKDQGANAEHEKWSGPGRIIGFEKNVPWLIG